MRVLGRVYLLASVEAHSLGSRFKQETVFGVLRRKGDRRRGWDHSRRVVLCGLAFTELNGFKLIWNSPLSLGLPHIKHSVAFPLGGN